MSDPSYKLDELARAAGMSVRTVRYYMQRGLLEAPAFRGKDTAYASEHLIRLRAIRRFQEAFFPLDAIAVELERLSLDALQRVADSPNPPTFGGAADRPVVAAPSPPTSVGPRQTSEGGPSEGRVFWRVELAPGVELSVAADAPPEAQKLVEQILKRRDKSK